MEGIKETSEAVAQYGFMTVFAVVVLVGGGWILWRVIHKLVLSDSSLANQVVGKHLEFITTSERVMKDMQTGFTDIADTLKEHTSVMERDAKVLGDVDDTVKRIEQRQLIDTR